MDTADLIRKIKIQQDLDLQGCADLLKIENHVKDLEFQLGQIRISLDHKTTLLASCETALEERDAKSYGLCPECGKPGVTRERRIDGNDKCSSGHVYKSTNAK